MLQLLRLQGGEEDREAARCSGVKGSGGAGTVDLSAPLTLLTCRPLVYQPVPPPATASAINATALPLLRVFDLPSPASSPSASLPSSPTSPLLRSSSRARLPHLVLMQRTSTGHHYLFNYGSQRIRHCGRRMQQQRLPISAHIRRCEQWQSEHARGLPHTEWSEVQGSGGKPLEDGDRVDVGGALYVYWSHSQQQQRQYDRAGGEGPPQSRRGREQGEAWTRSSGRAVRQRRDNSHMAPMIGDNGSDGRRQTDEEMRDEGKEAEAVTSARPSAAAQRRAQTRRQQGSKRSGDGSASDAEEEAVVEVDSAVRGLRAGNRLIGSPKQRASRSRQAGAGEGASVSMAAVRRGRRKLPDSAALSVTIQHEQEDEGQARDRPEGSEDEKKEEEEAGSDKNEQLTVGVKNARRPGRRRRLENGAGVDHSARKRRRRGENGDQAAANEVRSERVGDPNASRAVNGSPQVRLNKQRQAASHAENAEHGDDEEDDEHGKRATNVTGSTQVRKQRSARNQQREPVGRRAQRQSGADEPADGLDVRANKRARPTRDGDGRAMSHRQSALRARRSKRGKMRQTRSSGPVADDKSWPEPEQRRPRKKKRQSRQIEKKSQQVRRIRRTPLSLLSAPPATALSLLPLLSCAVCNQLFILPVSLPCAHSFCDYCLYSRLQLKQSACPLCERPVSDEDRQCGTYAVRSEALAAVAEEVARQVLDVKGRRARARRQRNDTADMKAVRAAWKRKQGAQKGVERRRQERERVEEELSALLGRRKRQPAGGRSSRGRTQSEVDLDSEDSDGGGRRQARPGERSSGSNDDDDEDDDDDYMPASDLDSEDSAAAVHQTDGESESGDDAGSSGGGSSAGRSSGEDGSGSSSSSSAASAASSDDIESSEEDSVHMDRSVILPNADSHSTSQRQRPQRTNFELKIVAKRSRPPCRSCSLPLSPGEVAICVKHGSDVRWTHIVCLRYSAAGRTIPLHRVEGMGKLGQEEQQAVRHAWHREANDGMDDIGDDAGSDTSELAGGDSEADVDDGLQSDNTSE